MPGKHLVLGILGYPVSHSVSPMMHKEALNHWGIEGSYVPFEVKPRDIPAAITGLKALGVKGVNVTIPHKQTVIDHLDELDPVAQSVGAVNTIIFEGDRAIGYNTDGAGFITSLKNDAGEVVEGKKVLLIGSGGAARGLAVKLAMDKAAGIFITNRTPERGIALVGHIRDKLSYPFVEFIRLEASLIRDIIPEVEIVVNATSVGMNGRDGLPVSLEGIDQRHLVCDIVYTPLETDFLKESSERGARTLDGLGMLIHQGDLAFQIWTDKRFPSGKIRSILMKNLNL